MKEERKELEVRKCGTGSPESPASVTFSIDGFDFGLVRSNATNGSSYESYWRYGS